MKRISLWQASMDWDSKSSWINSEYVQNRNPYLHVTSWFLPDSMHEIWSEQFPNRGVDYLWCGMRWGRYDPNLLRLSFWDSHDSSSRFYGVISRIRCETDESIATTDGAFFHSVMNEHSFRNNWFKTVAGTRFENFREWNRTGFHWVVIVPG
jgi:hypothetical protein